MRPLVVAALLAMPALTHAQDDAVANVRYPLNQRVRATAPALLSRPLVGRVSSVDSQVVSLVATHRGSIVDLPLGSISSLAASGGIDRGKGVRRGFLGGLALGTWFFADTYSDIRDEDVFGLGALSLGFVGFVVTPGIGALAGYALAPESWHSLEVPRASASAPAPVRLRLAADEDLRLRTTSGKRSGRLRSQSPEAIAVTTKDGPVGIRWSDVTRLSVRGEPSRRRGAARGTTIITGITLIGVATDPLPTVAENAGVLLGNAAFGALIGLFFPMRSWTDLPVPKAVSP